MEGTMKIKLALATLLVAGSASVASAEDFAKPYNISITGACDTLTLTVTAGVVVGQSNAPNGCDDGNEVGYQAKLGAGTPPTGKVLIAGSDLGLSPDAWTWAFNLSTLNAVLSGTTDGVSVIQGSFTFTFTRAHENKTGLPSAVSLATKQ
jgi:hypothetical protein